MEYLKIAMVQLKETTDIETNFNKHIKYIKNINADLILFPECSLIGYEINNIKNYVDDDNYKVLSSYNRKLIHIIKECDKSVIFGSIVKDKKGYMYNSAFIVNKKLLKIYKKINLTEEENKIFKKGKNLVLFDIKGRKLAPIVCRDQSYPEIFYKLKNKGAEIILILSAHYYDMKDIIWKKYKNIAIPITRAADFKVSIIKANAVGVMGSRLSHGNSLAVNKEGKLITLLDDLNEQFSEIIL